MIFNKLSDSSNEIFLRRRNNWISILRNQIEIVELSKLEKLILLKPTCPDGGLGSVEHYYHFIFDLLLPIFYLLEKTFPDIKFGVKEFGIFTERIVQIFPERVVILDKNTESIKFKEIELIGMNPKHVFLKKKLLEDFKRSISFKLQVNLNGKANKILLIERVPPDKYFTSNANAKGGGASRRSIINHTELASSIASIVKNQFTFHNLQLEKISLNDQIYYFDRAVVVIAQHGAGLANCVWMRKKSIVIELNNNTKRNHFRIISKLKQLDYFCYETDHEHININIKDFITWILKQSRINQYFQSLT